ncbi:MAG: sulfite exporter TauE/SafE family protein [Nostocaceae cyanobacterium]|nr:sulfite exporter TauE/SafE family protein [Nostocaceae cyanobacterium]
MFQQKRNQQTTTAGIDTLFKNFDFLRGIAKAILSQRSIRFSLLCALSVWTGWLVILGPGRAFGNMIENWEIAVTMAFGSMVAGGTSMGGGAVAFPVLTKWLQVPPDEAKVFSLAIQSIGMGAASLTIIAMKTKLDWRFIRWVSFGGVFGIVFGSAFLAPLLPPQVIKMCFTMMIASFGLILLTSNKKPKGQHLTILSWGRKEQIVSLIVGLVGGTISGLVGSGIDIFSFSVMVLLFGLSETISTPTSVILMAINAWTGFILHKFFLGDFIEPVSNYWLAAVPVVVVGAPTGAFLCSLMQRQTIVNIVLGLISIELVTSLILIPLDTTLILASVVAFFLFYSMYSWMYKKECSATKSKELPPDYNHD